MDISKTDWKLLREKLPGWQEAYMERLNNEYVALLTSNEKASDKFWALDERIKQDRRRPGVILEMSKSNAVWNIIRLIRDGVICLTDKRKGAEGWRIQSLYQRNPLPGYTSSPAFQRSNPNISTVCFRHVQISMARCNSAWCGMFIRRRPKLQSSGEKI